MSNDPNEMTAATAALSAPSMDRPARRDLAVPVLGLTAAIFATAALAPWEKGTYVFKSDIVMNGPLGQGLNFGWYSKSSGDVFAALRGEAPWSITTTVPVIVALLMASVAVVALIRAARGAGRSAALSVGSVLVSGSALTLVVQRWMAAYPMPRVPRFAQVTESFGITASFLVATGSAVAALVAAVVGLRRATRAAH